MDVHDRDAVLKRAFRYRDALTAHAFALLRDWTQAEDAVQDAFVVVMNRWNDFVPGTAFYPWLRQIVRNKSLEALRARARKPTPLQAALLDRVSAVLDEHLDEAAAERQGRLRLALQRCMAVLDGRALGLIRGYYALSETCEVIARRQNRSANAVRLTLSRLRRRLHECMIRRLALLEAGA